MIERASEIRGRLEDGSLVASAAVGDELQLRRTTDSGKTWVDVGRPMGRGADLGFGRWLHAIAHGGTTLIARMTTGYGHFVEEVQLSSPAGSVSIEVGRLYLNGDISPGAFDLSSDGQCASTWRQVRDRPTAHLELVFFDTTGAQKVVSTSENKWQPGWLRFLP